MDGYRTRMIRKRLRFTGRVQGVGFRYRAEHAAALTGATGWVRNDPDGAVSMELQATEEMIDRVIQMIEAGTYISIDTIEAKTIAVRPDEKRFLTDEE